MYDGLGGGGETLKITSTIARGLSLIESVSVWLKCNKERIHRFVNDAHTVVHGSGAEFRTRLLVATLRITIP